MAKTVAVLGASNDRRKYGNKAVRAFVAEGWTVYPVNPKEPEIEGLKSYASISDVPDPIDRVTIYLPPPVVEKVLPDIAAKQPGEVYFNPGTESDAVFAKAEELGLNAIFACSILSIGTSPGRFPDE